MFGEVLSPLLAQVGIATQVANEVGLTPRQTLTLALTAESLLFAAFSVSYNLAQPTDEGRSPFYAQGYFSFVIVLAISTVAISAGASLYSLFEPHPPSDSNEWLRAGGIAVAIVSQPFFALAIAIQARKS